MPLQAFLAFWNLVSGFPHLFCRAIFGHAGTSVAVVTRAYRLLAQLTGTEKQQKKVKQQQEAAAKHQAEADQRVSTGCGASAGRWRYGLC